MTEGEESTMFYSDELVEEIRSRNDIVSVIGSYIRLQKKGSNHMGLCPFHNEKTPSFSVSGSKQMYHCFGCGVGGNVFTFIMEYENYSFLEALRYLAERAGIALPEQEMSEEQRRQSDLRGKLLEVNKLAAMYFYYQFKSQEGQAAYDYLTKRGLAEEVKIGRAHV
jgi:DNA primase